jgi:hypothetical protein
MDICVIHLINGTPAIHKACLTCMALLKKLLRGQNRNSDIRKWTYHKLYEFCLLGCNAMQSVESQLTFWRKMEATHSSETLVDFQKTTWQYTPKYRILHNHVVRISNPTYFTLPFIIKHYIYTMTFSTLFINTATENKTNYLAHN